MIVTTTLTLLFISIWILFIIIPYESTEINESCYDSQPGVWFCGPRVLEPVNCDPLILSPLKIEPVFVHEYIIQEYEQEQHKSWSNINITHQRHE